MEARREGEEVCYGGQQGGGRGVLWRPEGRGKRCVMEASREGEEVCYGGYSWEGEEVQRYVDAVMSQSLGKSRYSFDGLVVGVFWVAVSRYPDVPH